jgi:predicted amidophosphoribosyltransferase
MSVVTCPYCQTANPVEQEFCLHCGRPLPSG